MNTQLHSNFDKDKFDHIALEHDPETAQRQQSCDIPWRPKKSLRNLPRTLWNKTSLLSHNTWKRSKNLHPTAYLDGLRGFAALLVYFHHHILWVHNMDHLAQNPVFENAYGYDGQYHFAALPGIRLFFCGGHFAVSTLFVISGYVLSLKPLKLVEEEDLEGLVKYIGSALFRRWLRLFLPILVTMLFYAGSWHFFSIWVDGADPKGGWLDEMWFFYCEFKNFSFVFKEGGVPWFSYNMHLWSIPMEFKGSMVVFSSILAFSNCKLAARLWCQIVLIVYFMYVTDGWYCAMFVSGMLLSHLNLLNSSDKLPSFLARLKPYKTFICYQMLAISIYLGGVPCESRELNQLARNPGWYFLSLLKPQAVFDYKWFYLFWAANLLVASVPNITWLKHFFETRFCQYLGRVSFALYMVHGPLLWTLGDRVYAAVGFKGLAQMEHIPQWIDRFLLPHAGPVGLEVAFWLPHLVLLPITLLVAHGVAQLVDKPSVKFSAWVYKRTLSNAAAKYLKK